MQASQHTFCASARAPSSASSSSASPPRPRWSRAIRALLRLQGDQELMCARQRGVRACTTRQKKPALVYVCVALVCVCGRACVSLSWYARNSTLSARTARALVLCASHTSARSMASLHEAKACAWIAARERLHRSQTQSFELPPRFGLAHALVAGQACCCGGGGGGGGLRAAPS